MNGGTRTKGKWLHLRLNPRHARLYTQRWAKAHFGNEIKKPPTLKELGSGARYVQADMNLYDVMNKCPDEWFDVFIKNLAWKSLALCETFLKPDDGKLYYLYLLFYSSFKIRVPSFHCCARGSLVRVVILLGRDLDEV